MSEVKRCKILLLKEVLKVLAAKSPDKEIPTDIISMIVGNYVEELYLMCPINYELMLDFADFLYGIDWDTVLFKQKQLIAVNSTEPNGHVYLRECPNGITVKDMCIAIKKLPRNEFNIVKETQDELTINCSLSN
jgi:hypothetical protein